MKPKEFLKTMMDFAKEQERWKALKPGDAIYTCSPAGLDFDYFKAIIVEVNVDERYVRAIDKSDRVYPDKEIVLEGFITQEEFDKLTY